MKNSLIFKLISLVIIMAVLSSAMLAACGQKGSESPGADNNYQGGESGDGTDGENKEDTPEPEPSRRVLLISIDGMRPDAIDNTEYGKYLKSVASYSLSCETVFPSVTLPCHMSMFHSVTPEVHGVVTNEYTPSTSLGSGIAEVLFASGKSSAIFYNWGPMANVVTEGSVAKSVYIDGGAVGWEDANAQLGNACIEYLNDSPADLTYLYLGFLDEWGHAYGWLSEEYYYALGESLALIERVIAALPDGYTVIITSDHGGHENTHGTSAPEDMTIPVYVIGDGYAAGEIFEGASILDVAPTVLSALGINRPSYWQGTPLLIKTE